MSTTTPLWERLATARILDLAHVLERGMPVSPNHPAFQMALIRRHGDMVRPDGSSAANEIIVTGGHVGTHIDALAHVSQAGRLHGDLDVEKVQGSHGFTKLGIDEVEPILGRGILLDLTAANGRESLPPGHEVSVEELETAVADAGVEMRPGDAVLLHTGWAQHWSDPAVFTGQVQGAPGPGEPAARWLADRGARVVGGETIAFEVVHPGAGHRTLPVHRILLVELGIHIIEVMNLSPLAAAGIHEFGFVAVPLKIAGATGSPIRPLALVDA